MHRLTYESGVDLTGREKHRFSISLPNRGLETERQLILELVSDIECNEKPVATLLFDSGPYKYVVGEMTIMRNDFRDIVHDQDAKPDYRRGFDSVAQAIDYCYRFDDPQMVMSEIVKANLDMSEIGFARELLNEFES